MTIPSHVAFGALAPCPRCHSTGRVRHAADPAAAADRHRRRAHGETVPDPEPFDPCPRCDGAGFLPPPVGGR